MQYHAAVLMLLTGFVAEHILILQSLGFAQQQPSLYKQIAPEVKRARWCLESAAGHSMQREQATVKLSI